MKKSYGRSSYRSFPTRIAGTITLSGRTTWCVPGTQKVARTHARATQVVHWSASRATLGYSMALLAGVMAVHNKIIQEYMPTLSNCYRGFRKKVEVSINILFFFNHRMHDSTLICWRRVAESLEKSNSFLGTRAIYQLCFRSQFTRSCFMECALFINVMIDYNTNLN